MKSKTFKTISGLLVLVGAVFGIVLGFVCKINTSESIWDKELSFNVGLMFETWIGFDLLALFFGWLGSALEKLENIERKICGENSNTNTAKPLNEYINTAKNVVNNMHKQTESTPKGNEWICPDCGKINQNYTYTCSCGHTKT